MSDEEQLRWEAKNGPRAAAAAVASVLFTLAGFVLPAFLLGAPEDDRDRLMQIDENRLELYLSIGFQALAYLALPLTLYYLIRVILARREEGLWFLWPLIVLGPVLVIAATDREPDRPGRHRQRLPGLRAADRRPRGESCWTTGPGSSAPLVGAGNLCVGLSYVLVGVNGMRAGVLSRFMGILGIGIGAMLVLIPGGGSFLQLFWLAALAALFLGRWPGGRGPAWEVVEPIPWPSAADIRALREQEDAGEAGPEPAAEPAPEAEPRQQPRKKKKRR